MSLTFNEPPGTQTRSSEPSLQHVDAIDDEILFLISQRIRLVQQLQRSRIAASLPGTRLSRENQVIHRYDRALGRPGAEIALKLIALCRYRGRTG